MAGYVFNDDGTRCVHGELFGVACYEVSVNHAGERVGHHVGVVKDEDDAAAFLRGEVPASLVRVYPI